MAGSVFDEFEDSLMDVVASTMGYSASWVPHGTNDAPLTGEVLFKDPTQPQPLAGGGDEDANNPSIEYKKGLFPGLKESVDGKGEEYITIDTKGDFFVRKFKKKYDGDTYIALLDKKKT